MSKIPSRWCPYSIWRAVTCFLILGGGLAEGYCRRSTTNLRAVSTPRSLVFPQNWSEDYPENCEHIWKITSGSGSVNLDIKRLDMEQSTGCKYDVLIIYSGFYPSGNEIAKLCGQKQNYNIAITSGSVYLQFSTDNSVQGKGFDLTYFSGNNGMINLLTATDDDQILAYLPLGGYPSNADVSWRISSSNPTQKLKLNITVLDIEYGNDCSYDSLIVYDGYDSSASILRKICGQFDSRERILSSSSQYLYLHFTSDGNEDGKGFILLYTSSIASVESKCSSDPHDLTELVATEHETELKSPNYPEPYPAHCTFQWRIYSYKDRVRITVEDLDIEYQPYCFYDALIFYDGYDESSRVLKKLCGKTVDGRRTFYSKSNYVYIRFVSDGDQQLSGFRISFTEAGAEKSSSSSSRAVLVAGIIGGICVFILVSGFLFAMLKRRQQQQQQSRQRSQQFVGGPHANATMTNADPGSQSPGVYMINPSAPPPPYVTLNHAYVHEEAPPSYSEANLYMTDSSPPPLYSNAIMSNITAAQTSPATSPEINVMALIKEDDDHIYSNDLALRVALPDQVTSLSQAPESDQASQSPYEHHPSDEQTFDHVGQESHQES